MEANEETTKLVFLDNMLQTFLNEVVKDDCTAANIIELSFRLTYAIVKFAYAAKMGNDLSGEELEEAAENATLFALAYHGREYEKLLSKRGLSYGEAEKAIQNGLAPIKKKETNKKEE